LTLTKGLPLTYNRDLQEDKPPVFDSYDQTAICLDVLAGTLAGMTVKRDRCAAAVSDPGLLATDLADYLVIRGVPFREAHHAVGAVVKLAERSGVPLNLLDTAAVRQVHAKFGDDWRGVFDLRRAMQMRRGTGMPGPIQVRKQLARWRRVLRAAKA
jgi:argininosuccinate lyase